MFCTGTVAIASYVYVHRMPAKKLVSGCLCQREREIKRGLSRQRDFFLFVFSLSAMLLRKLGSRMHFANVVKPGT